MKIIQLWHGGKDLEYSYHQYQSSKQDRWEYGPGLYLTTHYERAKLYAKGSKSTYCVQVEEGNDLHGSLVDISLVNQFISDYVIGSKKKMLIEEMYAYMHERNTAPKINISLLVNTIINEKAMQSTKAHHLNTFLVDNGVDYHSVPNFGGNETLLVVFNLKKIKKVNKTSAKNVLVSDYEKPFHFIEEPSAHFKI